MESKVLWLPTGSEASSDVPDTENQCFVDVLVSSTAVRVFRRMCAWRGSVPAAEAKKADDASMDTLRTPSPPDQTGRLA
jgi:hypothetical protein